MSEHNERRRFKRIAFDAPTELIQGERRWPVELVDISLKGLLVERPADWDGDPDQGFEAIIRLSKDKTEVVRMLVELRHIDDHHLGFICNSIDIDSMEHLRRLIELNLANRTELEREFHELIEV